VHQQGDRGKNGQAEFQQDPVVPKQAPGGAECLEKPGGERSETHRDDDEPADQVHREISTAHHFSIMAGQAGDAENQEGGDRAEPAYREGDMRGDGHFAEGGCHRWTFISDSLLGTVAGGYSPGHASPAQVGNCFSAQQGRMTVDKVGGASQELGDSGELVGIEILQQGGYVFS